ncbi:ArsR family transcriptional regulator [Pseudonocardia sulfidoxydans NBRC 16205]|uniref:ArsR family transcriptional regulator n=1 Tax=Pseudonocardia sulfidoxydans NBRC 16205 TaxID=1223511 RepID=A0A511DAC7_9PSEU|nr:helix-turn-helix domain-containing protein [Pseudonocardia sulfidoxydans]GEL21547.1 ArsR family transcriptional regulator [Pseudonocardia sulfidoxydans NBRC 16205]
MALPREYPGQSCAMARALEIVGERWTLLILRDAFFGVRRFSDFSRHLGVPRAVLTERLEFLVAEGVLDRVPGPRGRDEYVLTDKGMGLWPVLRALGAWGDEHYSPAGPRRTFHHEGCGGRVAPGGHCAGCDAQVPVAATVLVPGPGYEGPAEGDTISAALSEPHRLLEPLP